MNKSTKLLPVIALCLSFLAFLILTRGKAPGDDLSSSYIAGRVIGTERQAHLYSHDSEFYHIVDDPVLNEVVRESRFTGFLHPYVQTPLWALFLRPLCSIMDFPEFNLIFLILNITAVIGMVLLTVQMWAPLFRKPAWLAGCFIVLLFMEPLRYTVFLNQTHPIFLFMTLLAVFLAGKERYILAGLVLALAAAVKITPGLIVLYWLLTKRYRASVSFLCWSALLILATILLTGLDTSLAYFAELQRISSVLLTAYNNQSLAAFISDLSSGVQGDLFSWRMYSLSMEVKAVSTGMILLIIAVLAHMRRRLRGATEEYESIAVCAVLVAMTTFTPIAWSHYFIILIIPLMVLTNRAMEARKYMLLSAVILVAVLNIYPVAMSSGVAGADSCLLVRSQFAAGIILLAVLLREAYAITVDETAVSLNS